MFKKIISIFIASVLLVTCFAGCENDEEETYLACAVSEMPRYFDPQVVSSTGEKIVAVNVFDGLFKLDENGEVQKCAVKDYKISADGLTYTFYLKNDMKYYISDEVKDFLEDIEKTVEGKVTANDFVFGIKRAVMPETNSPDFPLLSIIKNATKVHNGEVQVDELGIRAVDEYTLEITLEKKKADFLYALTQPVSFPCDEEFFNLTNGRYGLDEEYIISNGSFYLSDIKDGESVRFSKVSEYTGNYKALPTSVRLYVNSNEVDIAKKVDDKTYDLGFFVSEKAVDELGRKVQKKNLENITTALVFNMRKENLQNVKLRTGLVSSIDKSAITENSVNNLVPSYYNLSGDKVDGLSYNIEKSRKNMISAFEELKIDKLTVDILCTAEYEQMAKSIVSNWQANIGVELNGTITVADEDEYMSKIRNGEFDMAIYNLTVDSDKSVDFLSMFKTGNENNASGYSSEEYDRIVDDLSMTSTKEKALYCESYLLKNAVVLPLTYENTIFAVAKGTTGVYSAGDSSNIYFYKGQK
ncbi:MAG: peptide ABC transporter substrate-binding protein [Clostridia bacterium]|nr:peptide ABC transporter substrate-binding protein [Clostridia bacterium]